MNNAKPTTRIVVAITGASGAAYSHRLVNCLLSSNVEVHLVISKYGRQLLAHELDMNEISAKNFGCTNENRLFNHNIGDVGSVISSGSFKTNGMVICPCSSQTLGAIAGGLGDNLIHRAAHVTLKELRRLVVVTREMPMSKIDLANAMRLSDAGAVICPAAPGFYMKPKRIEDIVDFVAGKILDLLDVEHELNTRWESEDDAGMGERV